MPCLKTSLCYSVHTELQTQLFLGSVRVFSVMKRTTLASCQGTESCPRDDLLNSTVYSWTYSRVIRTGRDPKNHSALLFYIRETQSLNWWMPSSVSNEWKAWAGIWVSWCQVSIESTDFSISLMMQGRDVDETMSFEMINCGVFFWHTGQWFLAPWKISILVTFDSQMFCLFLKAAVPI